jgi:hypothetical protein
MMRRRKGGWESWRVKSSAPAHGDEDRGAFPLLLVGLSKACVQPGIQLCEAQNNATDEIFFI